MTTVIVTLQRRIERGMVDLGSLWRPKLNIISELLPKSDVERGPAVPWRGVE
jgi:hypothetical protein